MVHEIDQALVKRHWDLVLASLVVSYTKYANTLFANQNKRGCLHQLLPKSPMRSLTQSWLADRK